MPRAVIVGSGSEIAPNRVTNEMMAQIMDTSDAWIRERSGVETRYFVDARDRHLRPRRRRRREGARARGRREGRGGPGGLRHHDARPLLPRLRHPAADASSACATCPASTSASSASGFLYGLQLADAHIRAGLAKTVLLVGAEVHTGFMPWTKANFEYLYGRSDVPPTPEECAWNSPLPPPDRALRRRAARRWC